MRAFRITDRRTSSGGGIPSPFGGRWNSNGQAMIYAAETFSGAILEVLVHAKLGRIPPHHLVFTISVPDDLKLLSVRAADLPGWEADDRRVSREFGDRWLSDRRTAVLLVPGRVTLGRESNILFNPAHPDFLRVKFSEPEPVIWDARLFRRPDRLL